ncbi:MAG TPA: hypothetical protein VK558_03655, partial [Patescibacteria group bacterium]|nr:hypothetical protein [Patescibacteria group bacterium]
GLYRGPLAFFSAAEADGGGADAAGWRAFVAGPTRAHAIAATHLSIVAAAAAARIVEHLRAEEGWG